MGNSYHLACWRGDVGTVSKWLNAKYPESFYLKPGVFGANAMHIAIYRGNTEVAKLLTSCFIPHDPWSAANFIDPLMQQILQLPGNEENHASSLFCVSLEFDHYCFGILTAFEYLEVEKFLTSFHKYKAFGPNAPVQGAPAQCAHFTPLRVAILMLDGNVQLIEELAVGADLEIVDSNGNTVLHIAALRSTVVVVKSLLRAGSSLSAVNADNMTPFSCAVIRGSLPILQAMSCSPQFCVQDAQLGKASFSVAAGNHFHLLVFLLKLGADINSTKHVGNSMLMHATLCDNVTYLEKLLENGANVHDTIFPEERLTALHWAADMSSPGVIPLLIKAGLPVDVLDKGGNTPLQSALRLCDSQSLLPLFVKKYGANINVKFKDFSNGNSFHVLVCGLDSCNRGTDLLLIPQLSHFQLLQSLRCDLFCPDDRGRLPIHLASVLDLPKAVEYILGCGFPLNTPTKTEAGLFPIHVAACHDSVDVIEHLSRLDPMCVNMLSHSYRLSPLTCAVVNKAVRACKRLLELGVKPSVYDDYGTTAMHQAAMSCPELVGTLAQHGCSVDIDSDDQSPLVAPWFVPFHPLFPRSFLRHSFKPIHLAAASGSVEGLKRLLLLGAQANALCSNAAPIHLAASVGNAQCVALLLQHGADSNLPGPLGFTALHLAAVFGKAEAVRILISAKGCSLLCRTSTANGVGHLTPLHCAALFRQPAALEALLSLPDPGINCLTAEGMSALHLALLPINYKIKALPASPQPDVELSTSLSTSRPRSKEDNEDLETVVSLLLANLKGSNVNTRNSKGHTAYDFAELYYLDCVKPLLKQAGAKSSQELIPTTLIHAQRLKELKEVSAKLNQYISEASQPIGECVSGIGQVADEYRRKAQDNADEKKHAVSSARDFQNQPFPQSWNASAEHRPGDELDARGVVKFALITANDNEWESAKFFMGAPMESCKISDFLRKYLPGHFNFREQTDGISVELTKEIFKTYCFVRVCGVLGVLTKCTKMGSYGAGAAGSTVTELVRTAREEKWELKAVFLVGCCGCASDPEQPNVKLGAVLIADPIFPYAGKVIEKGLDMQVVKRRAYYADQSWVAAFTLRNSMPGIAENLKVQTVTGAPFLSGDILMKWEVTAEYLRKNLNTVPLDLLGFEMEGAGATNAMMLMDLLGGPSDQKPPAILVVKGVCDSANSKKNECADTAFFKETIQKVDKDSRQQMCTMMSLMVVFRAIKAKMVDGAKLVGPS